MSDPSDKLYQAWHESLGHREYRLIFTMSGYGQDAEEGEAFLEGFLAEHGELGPVVSQDAAGDSISVAFSLRAKDPDHAVNLGWVVFTDGGAASGLAPSTLLRIELEPVVPDEPVTDEHALQTA